MTISNGTLFEQIFEYQMNLTSRRWQYVTSYLVIIGLLFNSINNFNKVNNIHLGIIITAIITSMIYLRLISRLRTRLRENGGLVNELSERNILKPGKMGTFGLNGVTFWLFISLIILSAPWFYMLLLNKYLLCFLIMLILYMINLYFLEWKHGGWKSKKNNN